MSESAYLTRAREWLAENSADISYHVVNEACVDSDTIASLASLLTQVRNETLEEAARCGDVYSAECSGGNAPDHIYAAETIAATIRAKKFDHKKLWELAGIRSIKSPG